MSNPIGVPNNPTQLDDHQPDLAGIRANLAKALKDDCSAFIKELLSRVSSENNPLVEDGDLLRIFDKLIGPGQGGVHRADIGGGRMDGSFDEGNAAIHLQPVGTGIVPGETPEFLKEFQLWSDSDKILHELIHAAGLLSYSDEQLSIAVSQMDNTPPLPEMPKLTVSSTMEERSHHAKTFSTYWDRVLRKRCKRAPTPPFNGFHINVGEP